MCPSVRVFTYALAVSSRNLHKSLWKARCISGACSLSLCVCSTNSFVFLHTTTDRYTPRQTRRKYKASVKGCQARCILGHWQGNILFSRGACHRAFRVNVSHSSKDLHCKRSVLPVHHYQTVVFSPIRSEAQTDHRLLNHERVHDHAVVVHTDLPSAQRH